MWEYGHHFCKEDANDGCMTQDYGVEVEFNQSSCARHHEKNLMQGTLGYIGKIQEIIEVDLSSF